MKKQGQIGEARADWGILYGEFSVGQSDRWPEGSAPSGHRASGCNGSAGPRKSTVWVRFPPLAPLLCTTDDVTPYPTEHYKVFQVSPRRAIILAVSNKISMYVGVQD